MARTKFEKFTPKRVTRSQINPAPYNPRYIDKSAKKKLTDGIRSSGLVELMVWNERTGHLVGGHQRLGALDELEGRTDYNLEVAAIDVDEATEKRINVMLNNPDLQGDWDFDKMLELFKDIGSDGFMKGGWDFSELQATFGEFVPDAFTLPEQALSAQDPALKDVSAVGRAKEWREQEKKQRDPNRGSKEADTEYFIVVQFPTPEESQKFIALLDLPKDAVQGKYVDGETVATKFGVEIEDGEEGEGGEDGSEETE